MLNIRKAVKIKELEIIRNFELQTKAVFICVYNPVKM
jgi:hypothetical protein